MADEPEKANTPADKDTVLLQAYQDALRGGDAEAIEASALTFFAHACEEMGRNSGPDLLLMQEAHRHEDAGDWQSAEHAYRQTLALAKTQNSPMQEYKAYSDLSGLYQFLGQKERATEAAKSALEAARRSESEALMGMALESLAFCYLDQGRFSDALQAADEKLATQPAEPMYDTSRARGFVQRARCYAELHQPTKAQSDLEAARPLLERLSNVALFAGVQSGLAGWWSVSAALRSKEGDFVGAVLSWRKAVEYRRLVSQAPQLEGPYKYASLAATLRSLGLALLAVNDVEGSRSALRESQAIRESIRQVTA